MSSVNKVILVGNLGQDPEVRSLPGGGKVVNLSVATSESWRDKNTGERKERVEWHRVVIFSEGLAKVAEQYLRKGSKVYLEGQLQTRRWTDQAGVEKFSTECVLQGFNSALVMLDGPGDRDQSDVPRQSMPRDKAARQIIPSVQHAPAFGGGGFDDDVPFIYEWRG